MIKNKVPRTKLNVFNDGDKLSLDVITPAFTKEACECSEKGIYAVCWNIFRNLLHQVAERAIEINDPILHVLMIRLNLYDIPNKERYKIIKKLKEEYDKNK